MAEAGRRKGAKNPPAKRPNGESVAALQLWQTFEYLSPQTPPKLKVDEDVCVWALDPHAAGDREMPWVAPEKIRQLNRFFKHKRRFVLFAGVIDGVELVETVRKLIGAPALDFSEQRGPGNAASFVIPVNEQGYVCGDVFISTVPWAIACIRSARDRGGLFDFSGFFGEGGVQERVKQAVGELLKERQLIETDAAEEGAKPAEVTRAAEGDEAAPASTEGAFGEVEGTKAAQPRLRTLDADDVRAIAEVVFTTSGWTPTATPKWTVQTQRAPTREDKLPEDPLNSFFAEELERIQAAYLAGQCGPTLRQYLETPIHTERCDVEKTREHLVNGVHPSLMPTACWPGKKPLVTAQQFAVNTIVRDLRDGGLFAVNGPPGTGKTTMLKDLLAAVVVERADVLASFANPKRAFTGELAIEGHTYMTLKIHERLCGFGIVVACANNGAAENISMDLPGLGAIDDAMKLDYFAEVADSLGLAKGKKKRPQQRWGLVSAALGRQDKRLAFANDFWLGRKDDAPKDKAGISEHEEELEEEPDEALDPLRPFTLQEWVAEFSGAVPSWEDARASYTRARERVSAALNRIEVLADQLRINEALRPRLHELRVRRDELAQTVAELTQQQAQAHAEVVAAAARLDRAKAIASAHRALAQRQSSAQAAQTALNAVRQRRPALSFDEVADCITRSERARARIQEDLQAHDLAKPGALSSLFRRAHAQQWTDRRDRLVAELDEERRQQVASERLRDGVVQWQRELSASEDMLQTAQAQLGSAKSAAQALNAGATLSLDEASAQLREVEESFKRHTQHFQGLHRAAGQATAETRTIAGEISALEATFDANQEALDAAGLLDAKRAAWHLHGASREDFHSASPYHDEAEVFHARRELFAAALDLHKAFVVHTWNQLKTTLYAAIGLVIGRIGAHQVRGGPMQLWDALFLVVPLLSTTFASFPRVFRGVGREELAWVLIDEAGQAAPQYCAGALWRAKRAVIVGDPLQLEPVVGIPVELTTPLRERCGADKRFVPPEASAQTLADLSNRYGMYLNEDDPERRLWLGAPLIVHRRCLNPMFEISNAIAYEGKMVYGVGADHPDHKAPWSRWLDADTEGNVDHWIPGQANRALDAVQKLVGKTLRHPDGRLRAFVITPFREVAEKMRELLAKEYNKDDVEDMCGTVHTFQGKEADYVVFLLGGDPRKPGVISNFAGRAPNLINVAVTRAKKRLYVLGNLAYWTGRGDINGYYRLMALTLERHDNGMKAKSRADKAAARSEAAGEGQVA